MCKGVTISTDVNKEYNKEIDNLKDYLEKHLTNLDAENKLLEKNFNQFKNVVKNHLDSLTDKIEENTNYAVNFPRLRLD